MNTAPKLTKVFAAFVGERGFEIANEESDGRRGMVAGGMTGGRGCNLLAHGV